MKKNEFTAYVLGLKDSDNGFNGKAFEGACKYALNGKISTKNAVAGIGKTDVTKKGVKFEIKSNCGTLDNIEKNDFVIYSIIDVDLRKLFKASGNDVEILKRYALQYGHVFTPSEFLDALDSLGLIRSKKSTSGYMVTAIQSFKNSKRKATAWAEIVENAPTLGEWLAE